MVQEKKLQLHKLKLLDLLKSYYTQIVSKTQHKPQAVLTYESLLK